MSCNSCRNKELNKRVDTIDNVNKILSVEFVDQHSMEEVTKLYQMGYRLAQNVSENINEAYNTYIYQSLTAVCTGTSKMAGNVVYLTAKPAGGTAPYKVTFSKDGGALGSQIINVAENQTVTYNYTTVVADVSTSAHVFAVTTIDSCVAGAKTSTESCSVTIGAAVPAPITSVIVRTKISETATSEVVAFKRFYGAGSNSPNTVITVDGATVMTVLRYPSADGEIQLTLTKRSAAYNICADTMCVSYTTGAPPVACNIPTCNLIVA